MFLIRGRRPTYRVNTQQKEKTDFIVQCVFAFILSASAFYFNVAFLKRRYILNKIRTQVVPVQGDSYDPHHNQQIVYFNTNHTQFPTLHDEEFDINRVAGRLRRNVQYCQWQEYSTSHSYKVGNDTYTEVRYHYFKGWVDHQINSFFFNNPMYNNPRVDDVPFMEHSADYKAGAYQISQNLPAHGSYKQFNPDNKDILSFSDSFYGRTFKFAGRSMFYREYERGFLEKVLGVATFFDVDNCDHFNWCTPGDTRVWFTYWAPDSLSVLGRKEGSRIVPTEYEGYEIGSAQSGYATIKDLLYSNTFNGWYLIISNVLMIVFVLYCCYLYGPQTNTAITYIISVAASFVPILYRSQVSTVMARLAVSAVVGVIMCITFYKENSIQEHSKSY